MVFENRKTYQVFTLLLEPWHAIGLYFFGLWDGFVDNPSDALQFSPFSWWNSCQIIINHAHNNSAAKEKPPFGS